MVKQPLPLAAVTKELLKNMYRRASPKSHGERERAGIRFSHRIARHSYSRDQCVVTKGQDLVYLHLLKKQTNKNKPQKAF